MPATAGQQGGTEGGGGRIPRQIRRKGKCLADRWPSYARGQRTHSRPWRKQGEQCGEWSKSYSKNCLAWGVSAKMINNYGLSTAAKFSSTLSRRRSEQTIVADGVFAAMEMDERLLFRRCRRRHMLIVLSSELECRRERRGSLSLDRAPVRFSAKRN